MGMGLQPSEEALTTGSIPLQGSKMMGQRVFPELSPLWTACKLSITFNLKLYSSDAETTEVIRLIVGDSQVLLMVRCNIWGRG